ncbi:MAG: hypothetical protein H8E85_03070 [Candidatus Marinimicrobia bacterium]|nr:hypothetical protein [Candidatus Neomarinimicrobiota bacterium]
MSRKRKESSGDLDTARGRLAGLQAIDPALDFGNGKDLVNYQALITDAETALASYNTRLAEVDELYNNFLEKERSVAAMNTEMLSSVRGVYGRDSDEYEQAGGTRTSEKKRPRPAAANV